MIENEKTHSAKYQVLYNRLTNGTPFTSGATLEERVDALEQANDDIILMMADMIGG